MRNKSLIHTKDVKTQTGAPLHLEYYLNESRRDNGIVFLGFEFVKNLFLGLLSLFGLSFLIVLLGGKK